MQLLGTFCDRWKHDLPHWRYAILCGLLFGSRGVELVTTTLQLCIPTPSVFEAARNAGSITRPITLAALRTRVHSVLLKKKKARGVVPAEVEQ
jgi:hypothetical protein